MPRYEYRCNACEETFTAFHSMTEVLEKCKVCEVDGTIFRVPSTFSLFNNNTLQKPGELVKEYIENTKQDILEQKQTLTKDYKVEH